MTRKIMNKKIAISLVFGSILLACSHAQLKSQNASDEIFIMTFNVETLFDTKDDPRKDDETFLPLSRKQSKTHKLKCSQVRFKKWEDLCLKWDWNDSVLQKKMSSLANAIMQVKNGRGPDILLLQEVENIEVLQQLNDEFNLGFEKIILIEGRDKRGIDVAIMSKLEEVGSSQLHYVPFSEKYKDRVSDSRGILEATFRLPGLSLITVLVGHFPAPFHPKEMREESLSYLNQILKNLPKDRLVVAGGDFNIPGDEDQKFKLFERFSSSDWLVAHKVGCQKCLGTTYYAKNGTWSFLDALLVRNTITNHHSWEFQPSSVFVSNSGEGQKDKWGRPLPFDPVAGQGTSDHFPLVLSLRRKQ